MNTGDIVKMKLGIFRIAKNNHNIDYTEIPGVVIDLNPKYESYRGRNAGALPYWMRILHNGEVKNVPTQNWEIA